MEVEGEGKVIQIGLIFKFLLLCSREKKKHLLLLNNNKFYNKSSCFSWGR